MKRKFALILSAVMAASSLPLTAYAANFKDINDVPWAGAETVINSVADKGLLSGYEDGTFRAKNNVTYCEAMQMVYNVLVKTGVAKSMDAVEAYAYMGTLDTYQVPKWAQMAVAYGLKNGISDMQLGATKRQRERMLRCCSAMRLECIMTRKRMRQRQRSLRTTGAFPARDWCRLTF